MVFSNIPFLFLDGREFEESVASNLDLRGNNNFVPLFWWDENISQIIFGKYVPIPSPISNYVLNLEKLLLN
jgi:hypothetical protein